MKLGKQLLMTVLFTSAAIAFAGGTLKAQDKPNPDEPSVQWSPLATPKVGKQEQAFSFRSYCTETDRKSASWVVEIQNNMPDSYAIGNKNTSLGSIESGQALDFTINASNCKSQPEITAVEQVGGDQALWYIYSYKDGKAKGKLHDATNPGWLGVVTAVAEGVAAAQQLQLQ